MERAPWASDTHYETAERWVDACLRHDDSLLTPSISAWSKLVVDEAATPLLSA